MGRVLQPLVNMKYMNMKYEKSNFFFKEIRNKLLKFYYASKHIIKKRISGRLIISTLRIFIFDFVYIHGSYNRALFRKIYHGATLRRDTTHFLYR